MWTMAKKNGLRRQHFAGIVLGLCFGIILSSWCRHKILPCAPLAGKCCRTIHVNYHVNIAVDHLEFHNNHALPEVVVKKSNEGLDLNSYINKNDKNFLLIGVITAKKYLDTRAVAAFNTWTNSCSGSCKVIFFSSEGSTTEKEIPLVSLDGTDDSYPPQRKSLLMLKYMHDNYINNFEWFMRADDDVFVKGDKIEKFLRSVNSSVPHFIGQAGLGKKEEIGKLFLNRHENFCMGGPGILFSHTTLRHVGPHVHNCIDNLLTTHEDVEVGRCVRRYTGSSCTWAFEMQSLFYQNYKEEKGSFKTTLKDKSVRKALTLHSIKDPQQQYRIQNYLHSSHIQDLHQKELYLQREITQIEQNLGILKPTDSITRQGMMPSLTKYKPKVRDEVLTWDFLSKSIMSHRNLNPKRGINKPLKHALEDNINQVLQIMNKNARQKGRTIDYKDLWYGYRRVSPLYGADYILDLLLTYRKHKGRKMTVPVRRHAYLHQTFGEVEFIEDPATASSNIEYKASNSPFTFSSLGQGGKSSEIIHFILPLAGKVPVFKRFMQNYEEVCLKTKEATQLHIVVFNSESDSSSIKSLISIVGQYQKRYGGSDIEVIYADGPFARARALDLGMSQLNEDSLLFFIDVDILFDRDALLRIRYNTIKDIQVYYPIVFSQYDPSLICSNSDSCDIKWTNFTSDLGYWRSFGYGIVSTYKRDLISVGGLDTSIKGWGKEDVDLYTKFVESNLTLYRSIDPRLVHAFHQVICDAKLNDVQYQMCIGSKASSFGSQWQLSNIVFSIPDILDKKDGRR
ncbi:chondroitin sulfate synthase 1-like [Mytilus californianus]|uniref:chondroitin sulfate synthase 1-like n=1 Tax=Mytilus californianus TaxID=6549 RepID=UPI0022458A68|nr:chondroitin sulfate synthase 1-like [Mytilus californianus]